MKLCITKKYGTKTVFENFSLKIREGEILCVLGASGVGKSTLLNILAGLFACEGTIEKASEKVGYIFQEPRLLPNLTVAQNLQYVGGRVEDIRKILEKVELCGLENEYPETLSGGEKQRVAIARAFLSESPLVLLDEPFSSLDTALKLRLINVFVELWKKRKQTAVFVTHDIEEAWLLGHRIIVIEGGEVVFDITPKNQTLPRTYGEESEEKKTLLQALLS